MSTPATRVIIVGAGISGLCAGIKLREPGVKAGGESHWILVNRTWQMS
jgi:cation diffusion facilitator CzcD-associated flavoprotein CzcO